MNDITIMHELDSVTDLFDDFSHLLFLISALVLQLAVDVTTEAEFENQVEIVLIRKESIQLHDIWVIKVALYFYFSDQLGDKLHFPHENSLWYFFQCEQEVSCLVPTLIKSYLLR